MINEDLGGNLGAVLKPRSQVHFDQPAVNSGPNSLHLIVLRKKMQFLIPLEN